MSDTEQRSNALNPTLADIETWLREDETAMIRRRDVADRLEAMSWTGILRGAVEDVGADEVLMIGQMEGWWPAEAPPDRWNDLLENEK